MPEFTNPYRTEGSPPGRVDLPIRADAWDEGYSAAQADRAAWLVSDEAVERVARALCPVRWNVDDEQIVNTYLYLSQARAVLAALRGDET